MRLEALSPVLGARVHGLDLEAPLSEQDVRELRHAFDERHLLAFRGAPVSAEAQIRLCEVLGSLIDERQDGTRLVTITNTTPGAGRGPLLHHQDYAARDTTLTGISLYAEAAPDGGAAATVFTNAILGWETLPEHLRARVRGRSATHAAKRAGKFQAAARRTADTPGDVRNSHPIELPHPRTGRSVLFLSELDADQIDGLERDESTALLDEIFEHLYRGEHAYTHRWQRHDLVVWDNVALQHGRPDDALDHGDRTLRRAAFTTEADFAAFDAFFAARMARVAG